MSDKSARGESAMVPFFILVGTWIALRGAGRAGIAALDNWQRPLRGALAAMFAFTASAHFVGGRRQDLVKMVPPRLPAPEALVTATGLFELAGATELLIPSTAKPAAAGLAALIIAMFPANVHAARSRLTIGGRAATPLVLRTVLQGVFLAALAAAAR
jgi:uncharacterized membrane protein